MKAYATTSRAATSSRDRLILDNLDVARRIALRVARRVPEWLTADDLVAAAMMGLAEAAERYDAGRGEPFIAFAEKRIRGAVLDELRRGDIMPRRVRAKAREVSEAIRRLEQKLGRPPEDEEIAGALGVDVAEYREELAQLTHIAVVDLEGEEIRGAISGAPNEPSPAEHVERAQLVGRIKSGLTRLPERDALILSLYYNEQFTYSEIAGLLEVSESRVCQLHSRALLRLRAELDERESQ
jgi:RNA polymerase sigma factor for flagellar operon FliA